MKWYVVVKVFYVFWSSFGPYDTKEAYIDRMIEITNEGNEHYYAGERVTFMGKEVTPKNVTMQCKLK